MRTDYSADVMRRARNCYAAQVQAQGAAWANAAHSIREGFQNVWILAGILALAPLVALSEEDDE